MKPHFLLKISMPQKTVDGPIMSGKLADDSQLGQLTSLFSRVNSPKKTFQAPKPPKKRYLEENYSQNNPIFDPDEKEPIVSKSSVGGVDLCDKLSLSNDGSLERNENDVPKGGENEGGGDDEEDEGSWRERLICWEKLSSRLDDKELIEKKNSCKELVATSNGGAAPMSKAGGRRGGARACKGQKYREFMWTNVMHHRRKSSRWELCQDIVASNVTLQEEKEGSNPLKTNLNNQAIEERLQDASKKVEINGTSVNAQLCDRSSDSIGLDYFYKKKKLNKSISNKLVKEDSVGNHLTNDDNSKFDSNSSGSSVASNDSGSDDIIGSKKRKIRKQGIRRLEPGSSFKDTSVVEESMLANLPCINAKKKKLTKQPSKDIELLIKK